MGVGLNDQDIKHDNNFYIPESSSWEPSDHDSEAIYIINRKRVPIQEEIQKIEETSEESYMLMRNRQNNQNFVRNS
jgi:hypothetical protein